MDTEIPLITLGGTHYEMGRQHGLQVVHLRPLIVEAIKARFAQIESDGPDGTVAPLERFESLVREAAEVLREVDPPILEMIRGQAEALELDFDVLLRYIYGASAGSPGVFSSGMNEKGLAIADTYVCSTDIGPGLPDYSLMMHILEEHDTVRSALDYLGSVPRMGRHNLILADAGGDLAVVELGYCNLAVVEAQNGIVVNTNHFVGSSLKDSFVDRTLPPMQGNSFHRYDLVRKELEAAHGSINVAFAQRLMATHAGPLASICRHLELGQSATISTAIYQPARRTLRFCHGYPCQSPYHTITLDNQYNGRGRI